MGAPAGIFESVHVSPVLRVGSDVCPFGLFPHAHPTAVVRVLCVYNKPTRWGRRPLNSGELAALMDVHILLQNYLVKMERLSVLSQLGGVVPGKTLLLGGDFLLGNFIRGGVVHFEERWYVDSVIHRTRNGSPTYCPHHTAESYDHNRRGDASGFEERRSKG